MEWCTCNDTGKCLGCLIRQTVSRDFGTEGEKWLIEYIESGNRMEISHEEKVARVVGKTGFDYYQVIMFSDPVLNSFLKEDTLKVIRVEE